MSIDPALTAIGVICVLMGILFVWMGDRELPKEGMFSARTPKFPGIKWLKWPMGLALIGAGLAITARAVGT